MGSVVAADDGAVWIARMEGLDVIRGDKVTSTRVPGRGVTALWQDHARRLWVGLEDRLTVYDSGQFQTINRLDGRPLGTPVSITEDREQNIWVSVVVASAASEAKLFRIRDLRVQEEFGPDRVPMVRNLAADPTGGIRLAFEGGNLGHYHSGKLEMFSLHNDAITPAGLPPSSRTMFTNTGAWFPGLTVDTDGSTWVSTWSGLVRWKNREMKSLTSRNGLPCDAIVGAIRDDQMTLWLYTKCGLVAIGNSELEQWWQQPDRQVRIEVLDVFDGAITPQGPSRIQPTVAKSPDGRLWFAGGEVVQVIDPSGLRKNSAPPPVYVEEVHADRKDYVLSGLVRLPARTHEIEIDYTALSYAIPQKVRFRYKLEGRDREWQDAGTRRQAFFSDLPPRDYRFRVIASNNDGVWNEAGALVDFSIAPAYYQTAPFRTG